METKANYALIGLFTIAMVAGLFGFVYWFQNLGGTGERTFYRVVFDGTVSGLRTGGSVLFNGIRVGEVANLQLSADRPGEVVAVISIEKNVAVRDDTKAGIEFQGLTGIAAVSLTGGSPDHPPLQGSKDNPPTIVASRGSTQDVTQGARDVLRRIDEFIAENQKAFKETVQNVNNFTAVLAKNTDRIDRILGGLEGLVGSGDGKSGEINEAARSIRELADNLDKRTADITTGINHFTATGAKEIQAVSRDIRATVADIDRTVKNIDRNPSRLFFGGSSSGNSTQPNR